MKKGFTLVEILLIVFLLAILGTIAVSSYINSTGTFTYLKQYKSTISAIRTARSLAINNQSTKGQLPKYYGVYISQTQVTAFADLGDQVLKYDTQSDSNDTKYDVTIWEKDFNFAGQDFNLKALDAKTAAITMPISLFYETGTGNLEIRKDVNVKNEVVTKATDKCISLEATGKDGKLKKYLVIFQVSGLAEEYDDYKVCNTNS